MTVSAGLAALTLTLMVASPSAAENWPSWRGPRGNSVSGETGLPAEWGPETNLAWKRPLPGPGGATPVIWEDQIFLTAADGEELVLLCFGTDGQPQWQQVVGVGNQVVRGGEGNSASPSPVTDGQFVWSFMGTGDLACFTTEGEPVWRFNVQERYGKLKIAFGMTSTPVLHEDRLFLQLIHGDGDPSTREATVLALDKRTGEEIWSRPRPSDAIKECEHSYASPMLYDDRRREFLLTHGADYVVAHRLSDGREIWRCGGLNREANYNPTLRFVASPTTAPGLIVVPSAKNGPVLALRPDLSGDVTGSQEALLWSRPKNTPDVPSPLIHDGLVYLCRENGNLICLDAKTGDELYRERTYRGRHRASPVYVDGRVILTARAGKMTVVRAGREFKVLARNDLGEPIAASPAISGGTLYLRTFENLWAVRDKE